MGTAGPQGFAQPGAGSPGRSPQLNPRASEMTQCWSFSASSVPARWLCACHTAGRTGALDEQSQSRGLSKLLPASQGPAQLGAATSPWLGFAGRAGFPLCVFSGACSELVVLHGLAAVVIPLPHANPPCPPPTPGTYQKPQRFPGAALSRSLWSFKLGGFPGAESQH